MNVLLSIVLMSAIGALSSKDGLRTLFCNPTSKNQCQLCLLLSTLICDGFLLISILSPIISLDLQFSAAPVLSNASFSFNIRLSIFSVCLCISLCFILDAAEDDTHNPILAKVSIVWKYNDTVHKFLNTCVYTSLLAKMVFTPSSILYSPRQTTRPKEDTL